MLHDSETSFTENMAPRKGESHIWNLIRESSSLLVGSQQDSRFGIMKVLWCVYLCIQVTFISRYNFPSMDEWLQFAIVQVCWVCWPSLPTLKTNHKLFRHSKGHLIYTDLFVLCTDLELKLLQIRWTKNILVLLTWPSQPLLCQTISPSLLLCTRFLCKFLT